MPQITAVIITLNEAKNIRRALESLQGVADEVLVLDSYSKDETAAICAEYGVRFLQEAWRGYSASKNYAHSLASHEWILSLDADEALTDRLRESIQAVKTQLSGAYEFSRLNHYAGRPIRRCGWYPDAKVRLFHRDHARWTGDHVHETLQTDPGTQVHRLEGDLLHFTYADVQDHWKRAERYARLGAAAMKGRSRLSLVLKCIFSPPARFLKMYLLQGGVLEGYYGWMIARVGCWEIWKKYSLALRGG